MVGVPGGSSGIAIAQRLGLPHDLIERARSLLAPESREATDLTAYLHRSRDELDRTQQQMNAERLSLEDERKKLRTEWVERQQRRQAARRKFRRDAKAFRRKRRRRSRSHQRPRATRPARKISRRKFQYVRGEARDELNAALVQTLADSQSDLGVSAAATNWPSAASLQLGAKIQVRGFSKPVVLRRIDGNTAEIEAGPLRMKVAVDQITGVEGPPPGTTSAAPAHLQRHGHFKAFRQSCLRRNQRHRLDRRRTSDQLQPKSNKNCAIFGKQRQHENLDTELNKLTL